MKRESNTYILFSRDACASFGLRRASFFGEVRNESCSFLRPAKSHSLARRSERLKDFLTPQTDRMFEPGKALAQRPDGFKSLRIEFDAKTNS